MLGLKVNKVLNASKVLNPNKALAQLPTSVCGLALGIASLGWCWEDATLLGGDHLNGNGQLFSAIVAATLLLAVVAKFFWQPALLKQDLQHPVTGGVCCGSVLADWRNPITDPIDNYGRHSWSIGQLLLMRA